ncbi:MAG: Rrf2 family transcriptional regulator [Sedimentisphaerales bacterium]|nr:Rrf2 family transcriptional regulator [Sedimentisphaerales bacterium]
MFELAQYRIGIVVKTPEIADSQWISQRFTEIIPNDLKHSGFVESKRG